MLERKIALKVIYDNKQEKILSYVEIEPNTLTKMWCNLHQKYIWVQYANIDNLRKFLFNAQILTNF